jgi:hypothetical protein
LIIAATLVLLAAGALVVRAEEAPNPFKELDEKIGGQIVKEDWSDDSKAFVAAMWKDYKAAHVANKMERQWHKLRWRQQSSDEQPGRNPKKTSGEIIGGVIVAEHVRPAGKRHAMWITSYDEYVGRYRYKNKPLEITQDEAKRFFVKLEGHTIPAVAMNNSIIITTGDVIEARLPNLNEKKYASLEYFMIVREGDKFFFGGTEVRMFDDMQEITRE